MGGLCKNDFVFVEVSAEVAKYKGFREWKLARVIALHRTDDSDSRSVCVHVLCQFYKLF